ncbi:hypothetical protein MKW92_035925 [Papaver armeniacum]|nr:hypothetical protein MKW92_035925 [Papaver armeniacum]
MTEEIIKMNCYKKGYNVWIEDKESAWVTAQVVDVNGKQIHVKTSNGKKVLVSSDKLYPRDPDADHGGVDDMTKLTYLNEPGVLYNLARRYALNDIYTYTGSILIAVNPFTKLPHLYNAHMMEQYKGASFGELSPHVFAVADASYRAMMNEARSQSILVSGESGAGKTETTKLIMQYLTFVGGRAAGDDRTVEQQVLESNPLLEAFGNARTVRNDNSSRFGKFVEIQFDANGRISGAAIRTYLLERSRVVQITDPERNYHIFYQLCASGKDAEKFKLSDPSYFHYLNQSKTYELDGVSSAEEYVRTKRAMDIVGISVDEQEAIFRTLAAILHLGNVEFSPGKEHDSSVIKDQKSSFHLQMAASLFMCDTKLLLSTLCTRSIQTREGSIVKALDCNAAVASRDTLAKTVYSRLFDWLVEKINRSVGQDPDSKIQIGVLDIYGFECFKNNSFEQFCINFANEKLQQHFNEHVFKMEQEEYSKEKINWSYIEFIDNQDVLDLIEKKPIGIIALLDEACMFPKSTNATFATKLFQNFRAHPRLERTKFSETGFALSHYAGKVTYQTDSFLDKNRDYVVMEHCNLLSSSKCFFVAGLFASSPEEPSRSSYKFSSVSSRFKQQLQALMETLNTTEPHYIRCVKPNSLNRPQRFENLSVLHQLRCGGVLEAVRISLAGYPTRRTYSEFVDRFGLLALELMDGSYDEKALTEKILHKLKLENFQLGKKKAFLRAGQIAVLDSRRAEVLDRAAKIIQSRFRAFIACRNFIATRAAAVVLQSYCRGCLAREIFAVRREAAAAVLIQKYTRRWLLRRAYVQLYSSVLCIQSSIRGFCTRQKYLHQKEHKAATQIQTCWRMYKVRLAFHNKQRSIVAIQCLWRQKLAKRELRRLKKEANEAGALRLAKNKLEVQLEDLTWRLQLEKRLRVSNDETKQVEISKLQKTVESLNSELDAAKSTIKTECNNNMLLKSQLESTIKEKSELESRLNGMVELNKENVVLKDSLESLEKENSAMEVELVKSQKELKDTMEKLCGVEEAHVQLQQTLQSMEAKLLTLEDDNLVLRQKAITTPPKSNHPGYAKPLTEMNQKHSTVPYLSNNDQKSIYETPTPTKMIVPFPNSLTDSRRSRRTVEKQQENHEFLTRCIKEDLGFHDSKPLAACIIYKSLLHWRAFESERTAIFDHIIDGINTSVKVGDDKNSVLPYWLSNASTLLCLLQRNLRTGGFLFVFFQGLKSSFRYAGSDENTSIEARYPAVLFKQQLAACAPKAVRGNAVKSSKSPGSGSKQSPNNWESIIKFLDSLMIRLRENHVMLYVFQREYVKSGLAELERWIVNVTDEFAGTSWHELNIIRQAVGFLVIHQKGKKSLEDIKQDLCPALTVKQIYRICTMYWDDKYGTQSVSTEVVTQMRDIVNKESENMSSNSFLLDDDLSIPFLTDDISKAIPVIDPADVEPPPFYQEYTCARLLLTSGVN